MRRTRLALAGLLLGVLAGCGGEVAVPIPSPFQSVSAGLLHSCGLVADGAAFCWGNNQFGQLGDGSMSTRKYPVAVGGELHFAMISPGGGHTCGIATGGVAYCWGYNFSGQLGDSTHGSHLLPQPVAGGLTWQTLSSGGSLVCGLAADSTAYCWGWNQDGQLGDGTQLDHPAPLPVQGGLKFVAISVNSFHACALAAGGQAYCWGNNDHGQLGTGDSAASTVPVAVQGGISLTSIEAGYSHTCGLAADGTAYCWGENSFGQVGIGDSLLGHDQPMPTAVTGGLAWASLSAGANFTCGVALGTDAAYCWGINSSGQLGAAAPEVCFDENGIAFACVSAPLAVGGGLRFASLGAGTQHMCGLATGSVAYCWGQDSDGQLGDGRAGVSLFSSAPVKVGGQP